MREKDFSIVAGGIIPFVVLFEPYIVQYVVVVFDVNFKNIRWEKLFPIYKRISQKIFFKQ